MGFEKIVIKQVVKVAKDTAKIEAALSTIQDKLINDSLKAFDKTEINPSLLEFNIEDLANNRIEDPNSVFTPENLCAPPPLTETQKQQSIQAVEKLQSDISTVVDNVDSLKQALLIVKQPLQVLEVTASNLNSIIGTVKNAIKVIKAIPIPTAIIPPSGGVGVPINVLTILSDSLDTLDKLLGKATGVTSIVGPLVRSVSTMITETITSVDKLVGNIPGALVVCSFIKSKVELGDSCPTVNQQDMNVVQTAVSLDIQTAVAGLGDSSIEEVNLLNETQLLERLQYNSNNPIIYKYFVLNLQNNPDNPYNFSSRRIIGRRYFSWDYDQTGSGVLHFKPGRDGATLEPLVGPIELFSDPLGSGEYSFASSAQVLVEEMKYAIDQFLIDVTSEIQLNVNFIPREAEAVGEIDLQNVNNTGSSNSIGGTNSPGGTPILPDFTLTGDNLVRPLNNTFGVPTIVSGSIQINKINTKIKLESFSGAQMNSNIRTILHITPPQGSMISRETYAFGTGFDSTDLAQYNFSATGSYGYLMKITESSGVNPRSRFSLISPQ
jgi:hypothetical protein